MPNKPKDTAEKNVTPLQVSIACVLAMIAFAANSVLCRMALGSQLIDPISFTQLRIISGAITLALLVLFLSPNSIQYQRLFKFKNKNEWFGALSLFIYVAFFSFAYVDLDTASGALILFTTVQLTMISIQLFSGNSLSKNEWLGIILSISGFIWLLLPNAKSPSVTGALLMIISGLGWAAYTLLGKSTSNPLTNTTENFIRCIPLCLFLFVFNYQSVQLNSTGVLLSITSGAFASGMGYSIWYFVVPKIKLSVAAVSQLSVPLIAAGGGIIFVGESISLHFIASGILILSGIALVILSRSNK